MQTSFAGKLISNKNWYYKSNKDIYNDHGKLFYSTCTDKNDWYEITKYTMLDKDHIEINESKYLGIVDSKTLASKKSTLISCEHIDNQITGLRKYIDGHNVPFSYDDNAGYFVNNNNKVCMFTEYYCTHNILLILNSYEIGELENGV